MVCEPAWESAPAMLYGGAFDVAVIWGLPSPLLLGIYTVRLVLGLYIKRYTVRRGGRHADGQEGKWAGGQ